MARIDALFDALLEAGASDLHLSIGHPPLMRLRGELTPLRAGVLTAAELEPLLDEILTPEQRDKFASEHDLDFAYALGEKARFRANYLVRATGVGAVFRTIPTRVRSLADLGCPEVVRKFCERRAGLVLVTGPTGSGKSTTLAAMIRHINETRPCHILTVEDPIEFVHEPIKAQVTHREIGADADGFPSAIRSAGREDPDVILIGELRGPETMKLALQLASFGVLVFATVHTNSAPATVDRFISVFPAEQQSEIRGMLAESLLGIVAQQLVKTADGKGRAAALEVLVATSGVASMIREGKTFQIPSVMQASQGQGMQTMDMALERLVNEKRVRAEDAYERAADKESFQKIVDRAAGRG